MEFIEKLVALIPQPRMHTVRYHGLFAPHSKLRSKIVPTPTGETKAIDEDKPKSDPRRMSWARLLKRVFDIDVLQCAQCGGKTKIMASLSDKKIISKILEPLHLPAEPPL